MTQKSLSIVFLVSLLPHFTSASEWVEKAPLMLGQGEQRLLEVPGMLRFSLGSPAVRAITPSIAVTGGLIHKNKNLLLLKGASPGQSDLWIWKEGQTAEHRSIRVHRLTAIKTVPALEKSLQQLQEVEVLFAGSSVLLQGTIQTLTEARIIQHIIRQFPQSISNQTQVAPELAHTSQKALQHWLDYSTYRTQLKLENQEKSLWLKGQLRDPSERKWVEKQTEVLCPWIQFDLETLPDHTPTVYFRVFLLELRRQQSSHWGLTWPSSLAASLQMMNGNQLSFSTLELTLQQMENAGDAKILSHPELVVRAPGEAELFSGGQLPLSIQNRYFSNVTWKSYGLTLRLKITHVAGNKIRLEVLTEMSHLDPHIGQNTIPGIQSNRMKTQIDAQFGVPLFLSGLLQQGIQEEAKGLPILSQIPILGALFGSQDFIHERSELVAILFPYAEPPRLTLEKFPFKTPKGPIPPAKQWISPEVERQLRTSQQFPWNILD